MQKSFNDFLEIYNAYKLYLAADPEQKPDQEPEQKPEQKPEQEETPAWAKDMISRLEKLEQKQTEVNVLDNPKPVGLEDIIKKMI